MSLNKRPYLITLEGNIGSGKSTLLNYFNNFNNCRTLPEPVEQWQNTHGQDLLSLMYKDTPRWGYLFQSNALRTFLQLHLLPQEEPIKLMERSVFSGTHCFARLLHQRGSLTDVEYGILLDWSKDITSLFDLRVDLTIYLQSDPQVCAQRISSRSRPGESIIPMDYLTALHEVHESWLLDPEVQPPRIGSVMVINADADPTTIVKEVSS